jgi:hypothetical protein
VQEVPAPHVELQAAVGLVEILVAHVLVFAAAVYLEQQAGGLDVLGVEGGDQLDGTLG